MDDALRYRCQELVEELTDYLDDALPPEPMRLVREHPSHSSRCSRTASPPGSHWTTSNAPKSTAA